MPSLSPSQPSVTRREAAAPQQLHLFPFNPYPFQPPMAPVVAHQVWIIDCKSCGHFLTNRGMKAVLLLRPNVALYSSDALPANCSSPVSHNAPPRTGGLSQAPPRTCECLTQTLSCHRCGTNVGYFIVVPCARCTSSISATNRATNGHRFVFHSSEVVGTERHYVAGESGVNTQEPLHLALPPISTLTRNSLYPSSVPPGLSINTMQTTSNDHSYYPRPLFNTNYLPTPPLESDDSSSSSDSEEPSPTMESLPSISDIRAPRPEHAQLSAIPPISTLGSQGMRPSSTVSSISTDSSLPSLESMSFTLPPDMKESLPVAPHLKDGDLLFWHHLSRHGEIPGVADSKLSRTSVRLSLPATRAISCGR